MQIFNTMTRQKEEFVPQKEGEYRINGYSEEYIEKNIRFLKELGTPTCISDLGIEPTEETLEAVLDFIFTNVGIDEPGLQRQIRREFARVMK